MYNFANVQVKVWDGRKKLPTTMCTAIQTIDNKLLRDLQTNSEHLEPQQTVKITKVNSIQKITKYLECVYCSKGIIQGTCTDMIICEHCGYMMKTDSCQTKVVAKIVIKMDDQEVVFKIDHPLLEKKYPGVISMDHSVLGRELLYGLVDHTLVYNTENFNVLDITV